MKLNSFLEQIKNTEDVELTYLLQTQNFNDVRSFIEKLWLDYSTYANKNSFIGDCKSKNFHARFWEMYLGCALLQNNFHLIPKKEHGPDLCISHPKVWIEARVATDGRIIVNSDSNESMNRVPDSPPLGGLFGISEDKKLLRYISGLGDKLKQYKKHINSNVIDENTPYVIALNAAKVSFSIFDHQYTEGLLPTIFKAVFPIGNYVVVCPIDLNSGHSYFDYSMYEYRPELFKENNMAIDMKGFLRQENEVISGLLFSKIGINSLINRIPKKLSEGFIFIHNPNAKNPLSKGWLKSGHEYWFEGDILTKFDHEKNMKEQNFQVLRKNGTWNLVDLKRQLNIEF